ncbi:MAG: DoxX family membrane protein [Verrucomicrobia subdivision 3 bacterium]|nr:DoxX family membrane protein [Limisphaerales bacterium]
MEKSIIDVKDSKSNAANPWGSPEKRCWGRDLVGLFARCVLASSFIYLGTSKALHPADFLKLLRQYELVHDHVILNFVAIGLPWFEIFCGVLLLAGVWVRGTALMSLFMLVPFSLIVAQRAWNIHEASQIPFCAIKFDCGCGAGEVVICYKLLENAFLVLMGVLLLALRTNRWSLRYSLFRSA